MHKNKLIYLRVFMLTLFLLIGCKQKPKTPNILFIFADDQRADALGVASNPHIKTPNLDDLAHQGVHFENCYVMGGHHGAICAPSRAMLLSGKNLFHVYDQLNGVLTLPAYLAGYGYETFATGKWHNGAESFQATFQKGAQIMLGGMSDHFKVPVRQMDENRLLGEPIEKSFSTDLFADAALNYLDEFSAGSQENPFFCYIAFTAPHDPRSPAPKYAEAYGEKEIPLPQNFKPLHPFRFDNFNVRDETLAPWPRTPEVIQSSLAEYYALIQHIDDRVGDLIARLKKHALLENTLIIYAADNGLAVGSHGLLGKQNLYEHSMKVPLIISGPGIPKGHTSEALVYLYDLFPTLTQYLEVPIPEEIDGLSLMNLIDQKQLSVRSSLYTAYRNTIRAVRDKQWKLIRYPQIDHTQLFNLEEDPQETNNLATSVAHQTKLNEMFQLLEQNHEATDDTINLTPLKIVSKEYDYRNLKQTPDIWQPAYILNKYFPKNNIP